MRTISLSVVMRTHSRHGNEDDT